MLTYLISISLNPVLCFLRHVANIAPTKHVAMASISMTTDTVSIDTVSSCEEPFPKVASLSPSLLPSYKNKLETFFCVVIPYTFLFRRAFYS